MGKMRKKFAQQYGFVVPEVRLTDDFGIPSKSYQIKVHGTVVAEHAMRVGEVMVLLGNREAAGHARRRVKGAGLRHARLFPFREAFTEDLKREQFAFADSMSVLLTHLSG